MGKEVIIPPNEKGPRCIITQYNGDAWAIFPGHGVLHSGEHYKSLETMKVEAISKPISVEYRTGGESRLEDVGKITHVYLNHFDIESAQGPFIDAAFAKLLPSKFHLGPGDYHVFPQFNGQTVDIDWSEYKGRFVVTVDLRSNIRWGSIEGANTTQDFGIGQFPPFTVTRALYVHSIAGGQEFAEPGMSGSIVFLTSKESDPRSGIIGTLAAIGYVIGATAATIASPSSNAIENNIGSGRAKKDFFVQPFAPVLEVFVGESMGSNRFLGGI